MECRDRSKNSPSGNEGHVCSKCGWVFPNPHPSARHRRAHKKVCGTIQVNDSKTLINGSETTEKIEEISVSGFGSGSYRSIRSEEDVYCDAVAEFADNSSWVSDSNEVLHSILDDIHIHTCSVSTMNDVNDETQQYNKDAEMNISDTMEMNLMKEVNGDEYDGRSIVVKLSESIPSLPGFVDGIDNNVEVKSNGYEKVSESARVVADCISSVEDEVNTHNHTICVHNKGSDPVDDNGNGDQLENTETSNVEALENDGDDEVNTHDHIICVHKDSDFVDDFLSEKVNDNGAQMEMTEEINVEEIEYASVEDEVNTHYHTISVVKASDTVKVNGIGAQMEKNESSNVEELESASSVVKDSIFRVEDEANTHNHTICVDNDSDSVDDSLREKRIGNGAQLEKTEASNVEELQFANVEDGIETHNHTICVDIKGNGAQLEKKEASNVEELESASSVVTNSISVVEDEVNTNNHTVCVDKASDTMDDSLTEKVYFNGAQLEKTEEINGDKLPGEECFGKVDIGLISDNDDISDLNQDLAFSQTDSLECNWGSISDTLAAVETGSSYKAEPNNGKSVEENTRKQHMPLKSYLGESSPSTKETISTVMSSKEWNSPAQYPSKGKNRRPYWAPFICCSSVETS